MKILIAILFIVCLVGCSPSYNLEFQETCRQLAENYIYLPYKTYKEFGIHERPVCEIFYIDGNITPTVYKNVQFRSIEEMQGAFKLIRFKGND